MKKITLFTFLTILLCTSCVTKKKFMLAELAATASKDSLQGLLTDCRNTGNQMSVQIKNLMRNTTKMGNSPPVSKYAECEHDRTGKTERPVEPEEKRVERKRAYYQRVAADDQCAE